MRGKLIQSYDCPALTSPLQSLLEGAGLLDFRAVH